MKGRVVYIKQSEFVAINMAADYVNNLLENCNADENTEEGSRVISDLRITIESLDNISKKYMKLKHNTP